MRDFWNIRVENGMRLITPSHSAAVGNAAWTRDNLWWRSRVETVRGELVSQGFGKFFNLGMGPLDLNIGLTDVAKAVAHGDAVATLKLDGSLLIRSVYKSQIVLRTRGSFTYEHLDNAFEMEEFKQKYPLLFDPVFAYNYSLLLEWVSPNNTIVIKYPEPELVLVGAVDHRSMSYMRSEELKSLAEMIDVKMVDYFPLTNKGWEDLYANLESNHEIEGYVIRLNNEQNLVKVKCAPYLTKHSLKSRLDSETLADMYFQYGRPDFTGFMGEFSKAFDEEVAMWAMPAIASLYDGVRNLNAIEEHIVEKVAQRREEGLSRKEFAIVTQNEYGKTKKFSLAMNLFLGLKDKNEKLLKSILLQNTKQIEMSFMKAGRDDLEPDDMEG